MTENREKTYVADVDRSIYDIRDAEHDAYRMESGLTPEIVDKLSKEKGDPVWMQQFRLQALQIYNEMEKLNVMEGTTIMMMKPEQCWDLVSRL